MAKAPVYGGEKVQPGALPGVRFAPNATGASFGGVAAKQVGEFGSALEQIGDVADKIAKANQKVVNTTKYEDNFNQYSAAMNVEFAEDFNLRKGPNAALLRAYVIQKSNDLEKKFMENLDNDEQRELFKRSVGKARVGYG